MLLIHSVGCVTCVITPMFSRSSILFLSSAITGIGTRLGLFWTGFTVGSISMWYVPGSLLSPVKISLYSCRICYFVRLGVVVLMCMTHSSLKHRSSNASHAFPESREVGASLITSKWMFFLMPLAVKCSFTLPVGWKMELSWSLNLAWDCCGAWLQKKVNNFRGTWCCMSKFYINSKLSYLS